MRDRPRHAPGELLGLMWDAVDLDQGRLSVRQTLARVRGRQLLQPPKTQVVARHPGEVGVPTLRFHDLRHTAVSLLLALGVPPHVVREIAGHSDVKVTMLVYAHGHLGEKAAALDQLGRAVAGTLPSTTRAKAAKTDKRR